MADAAEPPTGRVFISYRRDETDYAAGWLFDKLAERFGRGQIFKDIDSIRPGDDFVEVITRAVASCTVLIAVIDRQWLGSRDEQGRSRLDYPNDFVRLEIEAALTRNVRVIPILISGARMPTADELPPSLAGLARRHALELSPGHFEFETSRLQQVLDEAFADAPPTRDPEPPLVPPQTVTEGPHASPIGQRRHSRRLRVWLISVVLVVAGAAGGAWWLHANTASAVQRIHVGPFPVEVALSHDGKSAYVANCDCGLPVPPGYVRKPSVSNIDTATNQVQTVPVEYSPFAVTLVDNDSYLYLSTIGGQPTVVLDARTMTPVGVSLSLPGPGLAVAGDVAYAVNYATGGVRMRNVRAPLTEESSDYGNIKPAGAGNVPAAWGIAAGHNNGRLYLASPRGNAIYSAPQNQPNPEWTKSFPMQGGVTPYRIAVSSDDSLLYVSPAFKTPYLYMVEVQTGDVSRIALPAPASEVLISPSGSDAYVAAGSDVYDVDTASRALVRKISLGGQAGGLAITENGQRLYATNRTGNTITIVDLTRIPRH